MYTGGEELPLIGDESSHVLSCAMPILAEGDIIGCVLSGWQKGLSRGDKISDGIEGKLIQTAGIFLGKQMES